MANKINRTDIYPNTTPADADFVLGVDVSDTSNDANGEVVTFKIGDILSNPHTHRLSDVADYDLKNPKDLATLLADTTLTYTAGQDGTVAAGDIVRTRVEGFSYEVAAAAATDQHITTAGGAKLYVLPGGYGLQVESFSTIEDAITASASTGTPLVGKPGATYTFTTGVTVTDAPFVADFSGCNLVRGAAMANRTMLTVNHTMSADTYADADEITAYSLVEYDLGNGATVIPRITVADTSGYSVGDIVKVLSADKIPSIAPWQDTRYAEAGEIAVIDAANDYIYLVRPFAEVWTPTRICRMSAHRVDITGGKWSDATGYPVARNAAAVEIIGAVRPRFTGMAFADTASTQLFLKGCYEPISDGNIYERPRHSVTNGSFGYGEKHISSTRPVQMNATGTRCRHIFDTGGLTASDANLNTTDPRELGGVVGAVVQGGVGYDSMNAPFNDHPDAFRTVISDCKSLYTNRASEGATLWGVQLRGRESKVLGGYFEGLNPLNLEPSTTAPFLIKGAVFVKDGGSETSVAREPAMSLSGGGLTSGRARAIFEGVHIRQALGRKEIFDLENFDVEFSGSVEYAATLSNHVVFKLDADSSLTINRLEADFREATAATPMLASITGAGEVFAPGRVVIRGSTAGGSAIVLADFNSGAGLADFRDVFGDGTFFGSESGWRNGGSAGLQRAIIQRSDTAARNNDVAVNFSSGSGAKTITWPVGLADPVIYVAVNPTTTGTTLGTIPSGVFTGQRAMLSNVGGFSFEVNGTPGNVSVTAARTVAVGGQIVLRWNGTDWTA